MGTQEITGSVTGTGANIDITKEKCGFKPRKVEIINRSTATRAIWTDSMPDASAMKTKTAGTSFITSAGITPLDGGFRIGTDADLNTNLNVIYFVATA